MKLAPQSIPYRALQRVLGIVILVFFLASANEWGLLLGGGAAFALVLVSVGYEVAYYRRFEYELTDDTLDISSGVISRREREIPYRRIQNVDVSRSVIQRAIGVAAVDLETAGGSSTEGSIRFVTPAAATRLQREVQRRKSAASTPTGVEESGEPVEPTEMNLFAISARELALVGALSFDGRLIGLLAFLGSGSFPVLSGFLPDASAAMLTAFAIVAVGVLFFISWVIGAGLAFSNYYGFRLSRAGDELRYERGLFRRYNGSIPTEKVQTLTVSDNPAKRVLGYASLSIETAGYAPGQGGDYGSQAAVPIASTDRVYELAREVESFGDPSFSRPPKRIRWRYVVRYAMVVGVLTAIAFAVDLYVVPDLPWFVPLALLFVVPAAAHLKWKHRGYWLGDDHLLTRNGFWSREVKAVPYYRIQNVIDSRTIFQRRWNVATITADTAGTGSIVGSDAAAIDFDVEEAIELRETLRSRLQDSLTERRARRTAFEWFEGDVSDDLTTDRSDAVDLPDAEDRSDVEEPGSGDAASSDPVSGDETAGSNDDAETSDAHVPDDGVVRPDFSTSTRDYSEPAELIDTGEYAVDRYPSDADVAHRPETDDEDIQTDDEDDETDDDGDRTDDTDVDEGADTARFDESGNGGRNASPPDGPDDDTR